MRAHIGDQLVIEGHKVGAGHRQGEIVGVSGSTLTVRWDDGHQSVFAPGTDCRIISAESGGFGEPAGRASFGGHIDLRVVEDDEDCEAVATLMTRRGSFVARGVARRHPNDPHVPLIGEELAIGRALSALGADLIDEARRSDRSNEVTRTHLLS